MGVEIAEKSDHVELTLSNDSDKATVLLTAQESFAVAMNLLNVSEGVSSAGEKPSAIRSPMLVANDPACSVLIANDHVTLSFQLHEWRPMHMAFTDKRARELVRLIEEILSMPPHIRAGETSH